MSTRDNNVLIDLCLKELYVVRSAMFKCIHIYYVKYHTEKSVHWKPKCWIVLWVTVQNNCIMRLKLSSEGQLQDAIKICMWARSKCIDSIYETELQNWIEFMNCLVVHRNSWCWLIVHFQRYSKHLLDCSLLIYFWYYNMSGWGESVWRSAGEMGWRWIPWPGRLTNPWWSRRIWTSPDGAPASASQAAACRAEESLAEEEPGSSQSLPQLLQSAWGQGWRSDVCQNGTALPPAGITTSVSLHSQHVDWFILCSNATGWSIECVPI